MPVNWRLLPKEKHIMNLSLTEEQTLIQDMARKFALAELTPVAEKLDQHGDRDVFLSNLKKLAELGFMALNIDGDYGGSWSWHSPAGITVFVDPRNTDFFGCRWSHADNRDPFTEF